MSTSAEPVQIPAEVLQTIYQHARESFPNECCGWLIGAAGSNAVSRARPATNAYDASTHPTVQDRTKERAYVIAGKELLELVRSLDSEEPALVIYHSHPNGRSYFSETDQAVARGGWEEPAWPVQHLVIGIDETRVVESRLFAWDAVSKSFVEIAALPGASV